MMRRLVGAFAFTCTLAVVVAPLAAGEPVRSLPMQFVLRHEGPATMCRDKCRNWISAVGMIRPDTVRDFEAFAEKNDVQGATLVLDSEGGSVLGALALGRSIRRYEMTTSVGKTTELRSSKPGDPRATLSPRADCESMCAFVLLAGVKRVVPIEARVRVHQIWLGDRREDATAASYSAEDLVLVQRDIGKLAQYTFEMGGSADLLELSLRIPPWEPMRSLTRDELRHTKLDTGEGDIGHEAAAGPTAPIQVASAGSMPIRLAPDVAPDRRNPTAAVTTSAPPVQNIRRALPSGVRGWVVDQQSGSTILVRRHPLTVEGETIGTFDVTLTCGSTPNEFVVLYNETRSLRGGSRSDPVKVVTISMGQKSTSLTVSSSDIATPRVERETLASGTIPASAVTTFADSGSHSLIVETSNGDGTPTSVRVGNSGVSNYFPQLTAACAKRPRTIQAGLKSE